MTDVDDFLSTKVENFIGYNSSFQISLEACFFLIFMILTLG